MAGPLPLEDASLITSKHKGSTQTHISFEAGLLISFYSVTGREWECWHQGWHSSPLSLLSVVMRLCISAFQFPRMFFKILTHRDTGSSQRKTSLTLFFWSSESRCSRKEKYLPSWPQDLGWALPALSRLGLNPCQNCVRLWISSIHLPQSLNYCSRGLLFLLSEHTTSLAGQQNISRIKFYNQSLTLGWYIVLNNSPILTHGALWCTY